jgi:hypothetical protein
MRTVSSFSSTFSFFFAIQVDVLCSHHIVGDRDPNHYEDHFCILSIFTLNILEVI